MYSLRDKVVLITGGSRGLGLVLARTFAHEGAHIVIAARDPADLHRAHDDLTARGADLLALPCDVTDEEQVRELVRTVVDWFGKLDVLVNNAGVIELGPIEAMSDSDYSRSLLTHFWGPLWATRAAASEMKRRGGGRIVNVSSLGGLVGLPHLAPYSVGKFALTGLGECVRAELAKDHIVVTNVFPGPVRVGRSPRSLWIPTHSAPGTARRIVRACARGESHVVLGLSARLLTLAHALTPWLLFPSFLSLLSDRTAARNSELLPVASR